MGIAARLDALHAKVKYNKWMRYFTVACRVLLAMGFIPSGMVKIMGERFTALPIKHPMGNYLEALHHTGYYYTFIGILQVTAAILLLIPRTALLGAIIYFPIILNICILSLAVCFEGSMFTSPMMVLACLYLLCWDYDRLKLILPFKYTPTNLQPVDKKFPWKFFVFVWLVMVTVALGLPRLYTLKARVNQPDCLEQCPDSSDPVACDNFCKCVYEEGKSYDQCLEEFKRSRK